MEGNHRFPPPPPSLGPLEPGPPLGTLPLLWVFCDLVNSAFLAFFSSLVFLILSLISLPSNKKNHKANRIKWALHIIEVGKLPYKNWVHELTKLEWHLSFEAFRKSIKAIHILIYTELNNLANFPTRIKYFMNFVN